MADTKISALTSATTPLAGTEVLPVVQSGTTKQVSVANLTAGRAVTALSLNASGGTSSAGGTANGTFRLDRSDGATNLGYVTWVTSGDEMKYVNNNGGFHGFYVGATKYLTVNEGGLGGTIFYSGNLIQGTAAKGINFTANTPAAGMTSQLLNWYEQGTWTPSIANSFNNYTHTIQVGRYTRVGNLVTVQFTIAWTTTNAGGFSFAVEGLPFTPVTLTNYASGGSIGKIDRLTTTKQVMCQVESATASVKFYELNTGAAATALASASWNTAGSANLVSGTVTYQV